MPQPRSKALEIAKAVWKPAVSLAGDLSSQYSKTRKNASAATQAHISATSFGTKGNISHLDRNSKSLLKQNPREWALVRLNSPRNKTNKC